MTLISLKSYLLTIDAMSTGSRIEAYGLVLDDGSPSAYYTVDDETATIDVDMPDSTQIPIYNWMFLSRDFGQEGTHHITITTLQSAFYLDHILVTSSIAYVPKQVRAGDLQPPLTSTSPSSSSTSSSVVNKAGRKSDTRAVAGGVVGGVVFVSMLIVGILLWYRRKNR